jgi:hypothetical protein
VKLGDLSNAVNNFESTLTRNTDDTTILDGLASLYLENGNLDSAYDVTVT